MAERSTADQSSTKSSQARRGGHAGILRGASYSVAGVLSLLMMSAVLPPLIADQSDRAVVNAPVSLVTAPIAGNIEAMLVRAGQPVEQGATIAQISNKRVDRSTLISLEGKAADTRERALSAERKRASSLEYLKLLDRSIAGETAQLTEIFNQHILELRARLAASVSSGLEKKTVVERQSDLVSRNVVSAEMLKPAEQQYKTALHQKDAETAKLNQKILQLEGLRKGVFVGDELIGLASLSQKRRDVSFDAERLRIEQTELEASLAEQQALLDAERRRLTSLAASAVEAPSQGEILSVGAAAGRHVSAGDSLAALVRCDDAFVVAIFSYRQGQDLGVGSRVDIAGGDGFGRRSGVVKEVLPKTSDKVDQQYAVPFPQTERRELYVLISPDVGPERLGSEPEKVRTGAACNVGQWVTVTRANGWVPSTSVVWRSIQTRVFGTLAWMFDATPAAAQPAPARADTVRADTAS